MHQKVHVSYAESQDSRLCIKIKKTVNRAVASYVTTVNQLYISLLILRYLHYLPRLCGKRVVGCTVNSEARAVWNLSFYYVNYRYSAVIALGKSNEYCTEIVS